MSVTTVKHEICTYFGGAYEENAHAYLTPAVPGLGAVRRARGKRTNKKDLHSGMGTETHGTVMLVHVQSGNERRVTLGGPGISLRKAALEVVLHVFLHSTARAAEDAQDAFDQLRDGLFAHLRGDPTLGSGGIECVREDGSRGFQVAEGDNPFLNWEMDPVETSGTVTRGYLVISFDADAYLYA